MTELYRGHEIVMRHNRPTCAVIIDRRTGTELPTKVTALPIEADDACLSRARALIDLYLEPATRLAARAGRLHRELNTP
jgi:hypothetical protein